jgi:hypothetical protein
MTLGYAVAACEAHHPVLDCRHQVEVDPAEVADRYGVETTVPE